MYLLACGGQSEVILDVLVVSAQCSRVCYRRLMNARVRDHDMAYACVHVGVRAFMAYGRQ